MKKDLVLVVLSGCPYYADRKKLQSLNTYTEVNIGMMQPQKLIMKNMIDYLIWNFRLQKMPVIWYF